jgi:phosphonatase-like hydrolase
VSEPRLVVLDLAGTTVRDRGEVPETFRATLAARGVDVSDEMLANVRGASKREAIARLLPAHCGQARRADALYAEFRAALARRYREQGVEAIAGAREAFAALRAAGLRVALNTGFDRDVTSLLLTTLRWSQGAVDAVVCADDVRRGRPAPDLIRAAMAAAGVDDPRTVANVGDTVLDLEAGHAAGVGWNVGVLSGAHGRDRLAAAPHTHLIASVAELHALLLP